MHVLIPSDYELQGVVPICISDIDDKGNAVHHGWIEAVRPVADPIRALAKNVMGDIWLSSELAQKSVHNLSSLHGDKLGRCPSSRVWADAYWRSRDLAAGSRRARIGLEVQFREHVLACLQDPMSIESAIVDRDFIDRVYAHIEEMGNSEVRIMMDLYLANAEDEIPEVLGISPNSKQRNALSQRWRRAMRRVLSVL